MIAIRGHGRGRGRGDHDNTYGDRIFPTYPISHGEKMLCDLLCQIIKILIFYFSYIVEVIRFAIY